MGVTSPRRGTEGLWWTCPTFGPTLLSVFTSCTQILSQGQHDTQLPASTEGDLSHKRVGTLGGDSGNLSGLNPGIDPSISGVTPRLSFPFADVDNFSVTAHLLPRLGSLPRAHRLGSGRGEGPVPSTVYRDPTGHAGPPSPSLLQAAA